MVTAAAAVAGAPVVKAATVEAMEAVALCSFHPARVGHRPAAAVGIREVRAGLRADLAGTREDPAWDPAGAREDPADGLKEEDPDGARVVRDGTRVDRDGTRVDLDGARVVWEEVMAVVMLSPTATFSL